MSVNDSTNVDDMKGNCALCTVAGLIGSTAEAVRALVAHNTDRSKEADIVFAYYACRKGLAQFDLRRTLTLQMMGVARFLEHKCGLNVTQMNSRPLSESDIARQMKLCPDGTMFAVLVCDLSLSSNPTSAHWLAARKTRGTITYTDYQLDAPQSEQRMRLKRREKQRDNDLFGAPHETDRPMEAWGRPSRKSNRFFALAITRGQRQSSAVAAVGVMPFASGQLST